MTAYEYIKIHSQVKEFREVAEKIYYPNDDKLNQTFVDYAEMRKSIKKPMTPRAVTIAMNKLERLSGGDNDLAIQILEQSIFNCWIGVFPLTDDNRGNGRVRKTTGRESIDWDNV